MDKDTEQSNATETGAAITGEAEAGDTEVRIPGLPKDFAPIATGLQGREKPVGNGIQFADGYTPDDVFRHTGKMEEGIDTHPETDPRQFAIGQHIEGKGIYIGTHKVERRGYVTKVFDIYAAPEDFPDYTGKKRLAASFRSAVRAVNNKFSWHGYNGECFYSHKALDKALQNDTYNGGWFIPTKEMLVDMHKYKNTGALKGTFKDKADQDMAHWYWASTETLTFKHNVRFTDGYMDWDRGDRHNMSIRPVRAELRV